MYRRDGKAAGRQPPVARGSSGSRGCSWVQSSLGCDGSEFLVALAHLPENDTQALRFCQAPFGRSERQRIKFSCRWEEGGAKYEEEEGEDRLAPIGSGGVLMASPEYLVCLECETPCYEFEWEDGKIAEVICLSCGNEDPEQFLPPEDLEEY